MLATHDCASKHGAGEIIGVAFIGFVTRTPPDMNNGCVLSLKKEAICFTFTRFLDMQPNSYNNNDKAMMSYNCENDSSHQLRVAAEACLQADWNLSI